MSVVQELAFQAKYGIVPRLDAGSGSAALLDRLNKVLFDCDNAERRFLDDLKHARKGGQFTEAGIKARAGIAGDALLGTAATWCSSSPR